VFETPTASLFSAPLNSFFNLLSSRHKVLCLKIENDPKKIQYKNPKKNVNEHLGKKELAATARQRLPPQKKNLNSEDPSGSIRDITAHLIQVKNCTGYCYRGIFIMD
jgi:hypothetical protein